MLFCYFCVYTVRT
uniref:Uncharacterized protein n=1 Tax=Anguilla anguilla TaxID=7936 RepID=A0A0E9QQJ9_ANGAN